MIFSDIYVILTAEVFQLKLAHRVPIQKAWTFWCNVDLIKLTLLPRAKKSRANEQKKVEKIIIMIYTSCNYE